MIITIKLFDGIVEVPDEKLLQVNYFASMVNFREIRDNIIDFSGSDDGGDGEGTPLYDPRTMRDYFNLFIDPDKLPLFDSDRLVAVAEIINMFCDDPNRLTKHLTSYPRSKYIIEVLRALNWGGVESCISAMSLKTLSSIADNVPIEAIIKIAKPEHISLFRKKRWPGFREWLQAIYERREIPEISYILRYINEGDRRRHKVSYESVWLGYNLEMRQTTFELTLALSEEVQLELIAAEAIPSCFSFGIFRDLRKKTPIMEYVQKKYHIRF